MMIFLMSRLDSSRPCWITGPSSGAGWGWPVPVDGWLGLLAGFFGTVMGVIATIVVSFLWAGSEATMAVEERREHATSVSVWAVVGLLIALVVVIAEGTVVILGIKA